MDFLNSGMYPRGRSYYIFCTSKDQQREVRQAETFYFGSNAESHIKLRHCDNSISVAPPITHGEIALKKKNQDDEWEEFYKWNCEDGKQLSNLPVGDLQILVSSLPTDATEQRPPLITQLVVTPRSRHMLTIHPDKIEIQD